jgi:hypothetical protein
MRSDRAQGRISSLESCVPGIGSRVDGGRTGHPSARSDEREEKDIVAIAAVCELPEPTVSAVYAAIGLTLTSYPPPSQRVRRSTGRRPRSPRSRLARRWVPGPPGCSRRTRCPSVRRSGRSRRPRTRRRGPVVRPPTDWSFTCTIPVRTRRATFRPWVPFSVQMPQLRPCSVSLARPTASSSSAKALMATTGPKASVWCSSASSGRSVSTVAGCRAPLGVPPPVRTRAPLPTASVTRAETRRAAASSTSGPMTVPGRPGSPLGRSATQHHRSRYEDHRSDERVIILPAPGAGRGC